MRSELKSMGLALITKPPGKVSGAGGKCALGGSWRGVALKLAGAVAMIAAMLSAQPTTTKQQKPVELWLGGDVNLGDGGRGQLSDIAGIVQGAAGIVNLEGPVGKHPTKTRGKLGLWNSPAA